ncbi:ketopantoate reductase family protein [Sansalvadorimonas verongulae]|uniref:ketopantoate reductase family protein n=1 Tax=Sansalvadorimonas verongulae TaxID=2172824 RepID=UPI0012BD04FE|nr:2-dehydropantoate 2-reductase [Sansalvadorimonas verongulae]MTI15611.1 2-dehydropantoate 2-reductase [Sansalvadorimonas verongulae]
MTPVVYPHWHILGAGAIGCLWSAQLYKNRITCMLLVRSQRFKQLESDTQPLLRITEGGQLNQLPVSIGSTNDAQPIENLLLTTKAGDALAAIQSVKDRLTNNTTIVLLQNGMGSQQAIAESFPELAVYAGSTTDGAWLESFLTIHRAGHGKTWLGPLSDKAHAETHNHAIESLVKLVGMDVSLTENVLAKLQEKLAINAAINGMTALHNCSNGELLKPEFQPTIAALCEETACVLAVEGYSGTGAQVLERVNHVLTVTGENYSSSLQDVRNNRKTELQWINGYLLTLADKHNIHAPAHETLMSQLAMKDIY